MGPSPMAFSNVIQKYLHMEYNRKNNSGMLYSPCNMGPHRDVKVLVKGSLQVFIETTLIIPTHESGLLLDETCLEKEWAYGACFCVIRGTHFGRSPFLGWAQHQGGDWGGRLGTVLFSVSFYFSLYWMHISFLRTP